MSLQTEYVDGRGRDNRRGNTIQRALTLGSQSVDGGGGSEPLKQCNLQVVPQVRRSGVTGSAAQFGMHL